MSNEPPALSYGSVGMTFADGTETLRDVSFAVSRGEFVTIVGPSGCGKSTLLRIASGLLAQTDGTVTVDRSRIGYVFQDPTLLPWRTVRQNVELLAQLHDIAKPERRRLADQAIAKVGLVFLFDEPFGAVDEITRERLNDETQRLFQEERFAGLFITHSISEAVYMSTRVLVMSARPGTVVAEFPVPFAYPRQPELRFEPDFTGLCHEISGTLRAASGGDADE